MKDSILRNWKGHGQGCKSFKLNISWQLCHCMSHIATVALTWDNFWYCVKQCPLNECKSMLWSFNALHPQWLQWGFAGALQWTGMQWNASSWDTKSGLIYVSLLSGSSPICHLYKHIQIVPAIIRCNICGMSHRGLLLVWGAYTNKYTKEFPSRWALLTQEKFIHRFCVSQRRCSHPPLPLWGMVFPAGTNTQNVLEFGPQDFSL